MLGEVPGGLLGDGSDLVRMGALKTDLKRRGAPHFQRRRAPVAPEGGCVPQRV